MELESTPGSSDVLTQVFRNDRGLRAGWRLLIFFAIAIGIPRLVIWVIIRLSGRVAAGPPPTAIAPWPQLPSRQVWKWMRSPSSMSKPRRARAFLWDLQQ